jgi:cobalt/nickel transport system permease protein
VNIILALFGHGGITVIGLNTLILSLEGILGYLFFHLLWRIFRRLKLAVFLATLLALFSSTMAMIAVVGLGASHYEEMIHGHSEEGLFDFKLLKGKEGPPAKAHGKEEVHLARFVAIVLPLGFVGWVLEGVITVLITNYLHRLRPDLLGLEP